MFRFLTALVLVATASSAADPSDQFNLNCIGTKQVYTGATDGTSPTAPVPWADTLRVNLVERAYCRTACESIGRVVRVAPDEFRLEGDDEFVIINRTNGSLVISNTLENPRRSETMSARCERQTFSGFPRKF